MKKSTILIFLFLFCILGPVFCQEVIVSDKKVLLSQNDGSYKEIKPKILLENNSLFLTMDMSQFQKKLPGASAVDSLSYEHHTTIFNLKTYITYHFDYIDVSIGAEPQLSVIKYKFENVGKNDLLMVYKKITALLDGMPFHAEMIIPEQSYSFDYDREINLNEDKVNKTIKWAANCGAFKMKMLYDFNNIMLEYRW